MDGHDTDSHWALCLLLFLTVCWAVLLRVRPLLAVVLLLLFLGGCAFLRGPLSGKIAP